MPSSIAQLMVPADGGGPPQWVVPDWDRGKLYFVSATALRSYRVALETQTPTLSSLVFTSLIYCVDTDPVTGALLINRRSSPSTSHNCEPIYRLNPDTFAVTGSFGAPATSPSWPTTFSFSEAVSCVECAGVGYAFMKESGVSSNVGVIRTDTMQQAGFNAAVVSGALNNRAFMCRGASGPGGGSVFLTWSGEVNGPKPTLPLYKVAVAPGAETYNTASWPATNPHITSSTIGSIAAPSVDPAWTNLACASIGYDTADGNVLMEVTTSDAVTHQRYVIKVNTGTAAVIWAAQVPATFVTPPGLPACGVAHGNLAAIGPNASMLIDTGTGALSSGALGGMNTGTQSFSVGAQSAAYSISSDAAALVFVGLDAFDGSASGAPVPVAGTPSSFADGYALVGGLIPPPPVPPPPRLGMDNVLVEAAVRQNEQLVSLEFSDDRGHSWGSPVSQPIGRAGEYRKSLLWRRLGYARDRAFRISWSTPCATALQGCWLDAEPGDGGQEKK